MHRIKKLIGILFILGIVFFIICDEKGIKIEFQDGKLVFNEIEKPKEVIIDPNAVYKNSDLVHLSILFNEKNFLRKSNGINPESLIVYKNSKRVHIYSGFENPISLRNSAGMNPEFLAKLKAREESMKYKGPNIVSMGDETNNISDIIQTNKSQDIKLGYKGTSHDINLYKSKTEKEIPENKTATNTSIGYFSPSVEDAMGMTWDSEDVGEKTGKENNTQEEEMGMELIEVTEIKEEIDSTESKINSTESKINSTESKINSTESKINSTESKTNSTESKTNSTESKINSTESKTNSTESKTNSTEIILEENNAQEEEMGMELIEVTEIKEETDFTESKTDSTKIIAEEKNTQEEEMGMELIKVTEINEIDYENDGKLYDENISDKDSSIEPIEVENIQIFAKSMDVIKGGKYNESLLKDIRTKDFNIIPGEKSSESNKIDNSDKIETKATFKVEKYNGKPHQMSLSKGVEIEEIYYEVEKYQLKKHDLDMKKGIKIKHEFVVPENFENTSYETGYTDNSISESSLEEIISSDEIDINTLESENDEFLQEIFKKTGDVKVMNLIVETYLSEYQFVKAKKFIESLSGSYLDELDPLLNLKVVFNSFALTSKTTDSTLTSMIEDYKSKNLISVEDRLRYLGVISLMQQDYDHFFELANDFSIESHMNFAAKLQGYKDQISKQMGMPEYYFDTLVALELFNQGLFQPAKVLALYSLQQNPNYILPYQILAYANFLTNSRDTSIEYLKKLVDIDPNNAEKYRFLMGVAYYWDEKYQQSVVMLSLVKKENLRVDAERYLIRDYIYLDQKTKLISIRNKLLGYDDLVASDFYTYFYESFYRPFAEGTSYQIFAYDTELANKMIRVCSMKLPEDEKAVCNYGMIGKNVALGQYEGLEESLLKLATEYPQGYLYQALGEYYIQKGDLNKAKAYLLKAVSMTKKTSEVLQIKKLLQDTME